MKQKFIVVFGLVLSCIVISCSEDELEPNDQNAEVISECQLNIEEATLIALCTDGSNMARPDQEIMVSASFYSKGDDPSTSLFSWTVTSGSIEILNDTVVIDSENAIARSTVSLRINSDFSGEGVINVSSENNGGSASMNHLVELDTSG